MWSLIPHEPVQDALAILIILLNIPPLLSIVLQALYIFTSSSKQALSFFLFRSYKSTQSGSATTHSQNGKDKDSTGGSAQADQQTEESENFLTALLIISLLDLTMSLICKFIIPNLNKLILLLANSIIAVSLAGFSYQHAFLGSLIVISLDYILKILASYLSRRFEIFTTSYHVFPLISNPNPLGLYRNVLHFVNIYLAIHILLVAFCSVFRRNYIAKQLQYLIDQMDDTQTDVLSSPPISLRSYNTVNDVPLVAVPIDIAKSQVPHYNKAYQTNETTNDENKKNNNQINNMNNNKNSTEEESEHPEIEDRHDSPASYPSEKKAVVNMVKTSQIVSDNFSTFLSSSFLRSKNPVKASQPLWSFIGAVRAMSDRSDIYSGQENIHDAIEEQALVLNENLDYIKLNKSDEKTVGTFYSVYTGETIIAFLLNKKESYSGVIPNIITKVNGLIWYQVSRAPLDEFEELYLVSGLTPLSHYDIQFILNLGNGVNVLVDEFIIGTVDGDKIPVETSSHETNVTSPLLTLQESLLTTLDNVQNEKQNLKKQRKEITKSLNALRLEIEKNRERIATGSQPEANKRRLDQLKYQLSSLESEVAVIEAEYLSLEEDEQNQTDIYNAERPKYELNHRAHQTFLASFNDKISQKQKSREKLQNEHDTIQAKLTKSKAKLEKATTQYLALSKEIDDLVNADIQSKLILREERNSRRIMLLDEFRKEINVLERGLNTLSTENESLRSAIVGTTNGTGSGPDSIGSSSVSINGVANGSSAGVLK
ncbi:hypothetical protein WICPIJ_007704 [Wickerhamomyces pijperi]|uniref:Protein NNF2 n=1 Tax=Wickerhamomyces pijperi TaxID=599730 RepID=A0A9P8TK74_WICPI|nr:hypothetical protein WICPIJ_007704 [Wickerhamomyces pijperi]